MDTDKIMEEELHNMEIAESIENMPPASVSKRSALTCPVENTRMRL